LKTTFLTLLSCPVLGYVLAVYVLLHVGYGARAGFDMNPLTDGPPEEDQTRSTASTPIPAAQRSRRIPADFQNMATLVLSCRDALEDEDTDLICKIVQAAAGRVEVLVLANDLSESGRIHHVLAATRLLRPDVRVLAIPHDTRWTRDFGPVCVAEAGTIRFLDFEYNTTDIELAGALRCLTTVIPAPRP
jgi:peptidyl-arginine deiminase